MNDHLKLLDGSIDDVKAGLAGKSREDLTALRAAEANGKTRKGVLDAIDALLATTLPSDATTATTAAASALSSSVGGGASSSVGAASASRASSVEHSSEVRIAPADIDPDHPAIDLEPRANTTVDQNRIDFNDPTLSGAEAVERNLAEQAKD